MVTRYDYETIFYTLLKAADEAVAKTRKKWTPSIGKVLTKYKLIVGLNVLNVKFMRRNTYKSVPIFNYRHFTIPT